MSGYGGTNSNRSQASKSGGTGDHDGRRDSHDLSILNGRGRDSLLDNLLLSFDKIGDGTFGNFSASPFFSNIDEVDDAESVYSRDGGRRRSNSVGTYTSRSAQRDFGFAYDSGRDSRARGGSSSHGYPNAYEFESAPAPSIRTRNRTPSPPRSPRLVRRNSNKSIKSLRNRDQYNSTHESIALPPLPAFASPPHPAAPAPAMGSSTKANSRPGFFRRVFGGVGGSSSSTATISSTKSQITATPAPASPPPPTEMPQSVITKKASFFRRRKKSMSDAGAPPIPNAPFSAHTPPPSTPHSDNPGDAILPSPGSTSLRTAMGPYIRTARSGTLESTVEAREPAYLARDATIRTVSDPISPRRPSFFGDSIQGLESGSPLEGNGRNYRKESWSGNVDEQTPVTPPSDCTERPQTSPHSPLNRSFFLDRDDEERDMRWPPSPPARGILSNWNADGGFLESARGRVDSVSSINNTRKFSVASSREQAIVDMPDFDKCYDEDEQKKRSIEKSSRTLGVDTSNLEPPRPLDGSWAAATGSGTPTVTLQKDGSGDEAEVLEEYSDDESAFRIDDGLPEPTEEHKEMAKKIFSGDEEFVPKDEAAAWLGDADPARAMILKAFMRLFDWKGANILHAMRIFCARLVFKGETQQVDRLLVAFASRWCECNRNHGFKSADIVHTILYSLLLLNTDLHIADIPSSQRMTRSQFMKNTMSTIRRGLQDAASIEEEEKEARLERFNTLPPHRRGSDQDAPSVGGAPTFPMSTADMKTTKSRSSTEFGKESHKGSRLSRIGNMGSLSPRILPDDHEKTDLDIDGGVALVNAPLGGGLRVWETQVEIVLKDFYHSVKQNALPLHGSLHENYDGAPSNSLSVFGSGGMLRRSPSTISKAASDMSRGRDNSKLGAKTWGTKNRSRQRVYNGSFAGSSRTSLEDGSRSVWSPSASSTWSKYTLDKTQTSMSVESLGSAFTHNGDYHPSIGFANALSNAIIREEGASVTSVDEGGIDLLDGDDALELEGAPWAKEGLLKHKHHLESVDKRAKNRGWTECFAVIQRGYMRLFLFPSKGKSTQISGGVVGGGNWTENAEPIGTFLLRQSLASALPPPGYSKTRPNVWALSLPSGAVHFFEVGTADIVKEFVSTANYWSARLSKEPLTGGVSNVEYGWGDCLADLESDLLDHPGRASMQMSIRSSMDHGTVRPKLPGDKLNLKDWMPPSQSMVASSLAEGDQLIALQNYVLNIENELAKHQDMRPLMQIAFTPRHPNSAKAMANWEKKSAYLLREIIKFNTYIDTLHAAIVQRAAVGEQRKSWASRIELDATTPTRESLGLELTYTSTEGSA